jgi:hypothetical protein
MKYLFKLTPLPELENIVFDTDDKIDINRINRFYELLPLFKKIYSFSIRRQQPIHIIIENVFYNNCFQSIKKFKFNILVIQLISRIKKFKLNDEFKFFNDFILEKNRILLQETQNIYLPNRFKSGYFFSNEDECFKYYRSLQNGYYSCYLIKYEIIEERYSYKFDNRFLSSFDDSFDSVKFDVNAQNFLLGEISSDPIIETLFSGKLKVISCIEYLK